MAAYEVITLVEGTPQLRAPGAGDTYSMPRPLAIAPDAGSALTLTGGTVTTSNPLITGTQTWNAGAVTFTGWKLNVTNTASAAASLLLDLQVGGSSVFNVRRDGRFFGPVWSNIAGTVVASIEAVGSGTGIAIYPAGTSGLNVSSSTGIIQINGDTTLARAAAGIMHLGATSTSNGAALQFVEQTAPAAPSANYVRVYAQDNGAGKTQLMALFGSGAAQQIAIEP